VRRLVEKVSGRNGERLHFERLPVEKPFVERLPVEILLVERLLVERLPDERRCRREGETESDERRVVGKIDCRWLGQRFGRESKRGLGGRLFDREDDRR